MPLLANVLNNRAMLQQSAGMHPRGRASMGDYYAALQRGDQQQESMLSFLAQQALQDNWLRNRYAQGLQAQQSGANSERARMQELLAAQMGDRNAANERLRMQEMLGVQNRHAAELQNTHSLVEQGNRFGHERGLQQLVGDQRMDVERFQADRSRQEMADRAGYEQQLQQLLADRSMQELLVRFGQERGMQELLGDQAGQQMDQKFQQAQQMGEREMLMQRDQEFQQQLGSLAQNAHRLTPQGRQAYQKVRNVLQTLDEAYNGGQGRLRLEEYLAERAKVAQQFAQMPWQSPDLSVSTGDYPGDTKVFGNRLYRKTPDGKYEDIGPDPNMDSAAEINKRLIPLKGLNNKPLAYLQLDPTGNIKPVLGPADLTSRQEQLAIPQQGLGSMAEFMDQATLSERDPRTGQVLGRWARDAKGGLQFVPLPSSLQAGSGSRSGATGGSAGGSGADTSGARPRTQAEFFDLRSQARVDVLRAKGAVNGRDPVTGEKVPVSEQELAAEMARLIEEHRRFNQLTELIYGSGPEMLPIVGNNSR